MSEKSELAEAPYVSFATYRKAGAEVATPVWCAEDNGTYYIFSAAHAGKIKRLRNSNRARFAVCDLRGKVLGEWLDATAEIITDQSDVDRALTALRRKYRWQMCAADLGAKITGRFNKRVYIRARLLDESLPA